jgi:tRNA threonylcarbamoyladenosine biosynthesis protein TsaB
LRLLVFDTAGTGCSAGIVRDAEIVAMRSLDGAQGHAERLPGLLSAVLADAGLTLGSLDLLAVTVGPGSFSGIRTGLAAARGIALVTGMRVMPVTTLEALAAQLAQTFADSGPPMRLPIVAVRDARRGQVFIQRFEAEGRPVDRPRNLTPAAAAAELDGRLRLVGDGVPLLLSCLTADRAARLEVLPDAVAGAEGVATAALAALARGEEPVDGFALAPLYIRDADARPGAGRSLLPVGG